MVLTISARIQVGLVKIGLPFHVLFMGTLFSSKCSSIDCELWSAFAWGEAEFLFMHYFY